MTVPLLLLAAAGLVGLTGLVALGVQVCRLRREVAVQRHAAEHEVDRPGPGLRERDKAPALPKPRGDGGKRGEAEAGGRAGEKARRVGEGASPCGTPGPGV